MSIKFSGVSAYKKEREKKVVLVGKDIACNQKLDK